MRALGQALNLRTPVCSTRAQIRDIWRAHASSAFYLRPSWARLDGVLLLLLLSLFVGWLVPWWLRQEIARGMAYTWAPQVLVTFGLSQLLLQVPFVLWLLLAHGDWAVHYTVPAQAIPSAAIMVLMMVPPSITLLCFMTGVFWVSRERSRWVAGAAASSFAVFCAVALLLRSRLAGPPAHKLSLGPGEAASLPISFFAVLGIALGVAALGQWFLGNRLRKSLTSLM